MEENDQLSEILINASADGDFLITLAKEYKGKRPYREDVGELLASLHNEQKIDLLKEFSGLFKAENEHSFFDVRNAFEQALPTLIAEVTPVMSCVRHLTIEAGNDLAAGWVITPFIEYLKAGPERPMQAINVELDSPNADVNLVCPAIIAGSKLDFDLYCKKAIGLINEESEEIVSNAIYSLGRIEFNSEVNLAQSAITEISKKVDDTSSKVLGCSLRTIASLRKLFPELKEATLEIANKITTKIDESILHSATEVLFFDKKDLDVDVQKVILNYCLNVDLKNLGSINNLDYGLAHILKSNESRQAIDFVEAYIRNNKNSDIIKCFDSFSNELINEKDTFNRVVTKWLLSDCMSVAKSVLTIFDFINDDKFELRANFDDIRNVSSEMQYLSCKKSCGWLFTHPVAATSFIMSIIEGASDNDRDKIQNLIFNPLLISYSGMVKGYLSSIAGSENENVRITVKNLLFQQETYHEGLKAAWDIKELSPSISQRESYNRYHAEAMNEAMEKQPPGLLASLFTPTVLLYGNSSIHHIHHGPDQDTTRQEVKMHTISHSIEFPRLQQIDPHGLDYVLRVFRMEGCSS
ncbi:hypothetical protein [Teredinibacter haidensis]|uniref:hypothetical protein n=1 Tax=Teredinibacter haidensis TaxID=2731755 RepID=UPI00094904D5|nr:hypothetical protein [Teredinibacter haidensis]